MTMVTGMVKHRFPALLAYPAAPGHNPTKQLLGWHVFQAAGPRGIR